VGKAHPEEVISAVIASSQHHTSMVAGEESADRGDEKLGRERRGIGTQYARGGMARCEHLLDCMEEAASEPIYALRDWYGAVSQNADGSLRHMRDKGLFCS
jgi:hypothetical protein